MSAPAPARRPTDPLDLRAFLSEFSRLPRLGDNPPPWSYRGWLLPYIVLLHEDCPAVSDRWGYYCRTLEAGKLLDEPIPQIAFGQPDQRVFKLLHEWSRLVGWGCGGWSDFRSLLDWLAWGLRVSEEPPRLSDEVCEKLYRGVDLSPLLQQPHDYLGAHVSQGKARGWNPTCFYPTPHPVVECMVRMTFHDALTEGRDTRLMTVNDPCVGSGRMLLHASNFSLRLSGQDIDPLAVTMCLINGVLYAPWLTFPFPSSLLGLPDEQPGT
jgi:hypothetical protein